MNTFLNKLKGGIGEVSDTSLYIEALTHPSFNVGKKGRDNQRLEFLGDAILGLIVSEHLYEYYPDKTEGELTLIKSSLVSTKSLSARGKELGLQKLVRVGRGIKKNSLPSSVLEDAMEALVAVIYLDKGYDMAKKFVHEYIIRDLDKDISAFDFISFKSMLQELSQKNYGEIPVYEVTKKWGPDHQKTFEVIVRVHGKSYGPANGRSKKEAEQKCAKIALEELKS